LAIGVAEIAGQLWCIFSIIVLLAKLKFAPKVLAMMPAESGPSEVQTQDPNSKV